MKSFLKNKYLIVPIVVLVVWFLVHTTVILIDGFGSAANNLKNCDLGVVLGNKVELDGKPSNRLRARLDTALKLLENGTVKNLLMSGAKGKEGFEETDVMREYAVQRGVDGQKIIVDSEGYNTHKTAENTKKIMEQKGFDCVVVITHYYHISRTKLAFQKVGLGDKLSTKSESMANDPTGVHYASTISFELRDLYSILREFVGYYGYLLR